MARVRIKGVQELAKRLNRNLKIQLNKLFRNKALRLKIGAMVIADIKKNVSFGSPEDSTYRWRERYDILNQTDPAYRRNKLNAVFTGELLEDLKNSVRGVPTEKAFEIEHSDKLHKRYQGVNGKIGKRTPYSTISEHLIDDLGYNYLQLSEKGKKQIANLIKDEIAKLLA